MPRLGLSRVWFNMVRFHSSELWITLELIGFSSVRFKWCGSLGRSNHVGRLDRRDVTRLFFRIQHSYSATTKPRRGEGMCDTAVLLHWPWLWFMWPRHEIRDINLFLPVTLVVILDELRLWSLCGRVVSFIVAQVHSTKCQTSCHSLPSYLLPFFSTPIWQLQISHLQLTRRLAQMFPFLS